MIGNKIIGIYSTTSTNDLAKELAEKGYPEGLVVLAEEQTKGKGRNQRTWFSPAGKGIYLSVILTPPIPNEKLHLLTLIAALATTDAIYMTTGIDINIKWPNDLVKNNKKVGGILLESFFVANRLKYLILGIGINLQGQKNDFPIELRERAASLDDELPVNFSKTQLIYQILNCLDQEYKNFCQTLFFDINRCREKMSFMWGKSGMILEDDKVIHQGVLLDLDEEGSIIIKCENEVVKVKNGELSLKLI